MIVVFFFNDTATTEIYTLSLHDALPICRQPDPRGLPERRRRPVALADLTPTWHRATAPLLRLGRRRRRDRSEEHTSELQSRQYLVCRLLLEKKNKSCRKIARAHV